MNQRAGVCQEKLIASRLRGGSGNQLFQYTAGRSVADDLGVELLLDASILSAKGTRRPYARVYELGSLNIRASVVHDPEDVCRTQESTSMITVGGRGPLRVLTEDRSIPPVDLRFWGPGLYLEGFWQSEDYFKHRAAAIRADLALPYSTSEWASRVGEIDRELCVSVHVRRTDYLREPRKFPVLPVAYYQRAFEYLGNRWTYVIFSDDPEWCRANLAPEKRVVVETGAPLTDLGLMAACRHSIIANSSYSWWGAWLNPQPDQVVIAPSRWFGPEFKYADTSRLIPDGWLRLDATS